MLDRVGNTCVLCYCLISKINFTLCINSYVLKKSISSDRIVDIRLRLFAEVDNFCVAAALEVEDTVVIPAVLVITYKDASEWEFKAKDLAGRFIKNFAKYEGNAAGKALVAAGPQL